MPLGIDNLKKAVKFSLDLTKQVEVSGKDGFTWMDSFSFVDELIQVPGLISSGDEILAELKDLSPEEKDELNLFVQSYLDLENDRTEGIVEDALNLAFSLVSLWLKIKPVAVEQPPVEEPPTEGGTNTGSTSPGE